MFERLNSVRWRQISGELYEKRDPYLGPDLDEPRPSCREHAIRISLDLLRQRLYLSRRLPKRDYFPIRILSFEDK